MKLAVAVLGAVIIGIMAQASLEPNDAEILSVTRRRDGKYEVVCSNKVVRTVVRTQAFDRHVCQE